MPRPCPLPPAQPFPVPALSQPHHPSPAASAQRWGGLGLGKSVHSRPSRPGSNHTTTSFKMIMLIIIIIILFVDHCRLSFFSIPPHPCWHYGVGGVEIQTWGCLQTRSGGGGQTLLPDKALLPHPHPRYRPYTPTHTDRPTKTDPAQTNTHTAQHTDRGQTAHQQ